AQAIAIRAGESLNTLGAAQSYMDRPGKIRDPFTLYFVTCALAKAAESERREDVAAATRHMVGALFFELGRPLDRRSVSTPSAGPNRRSITPRRNFRIGPVLIACMHLAT